MQIFKLDPLKNKRSHNTLEFYEPAAFKTTLYRARNLFF